MKFLMIAFLAIVLLVGGVSSLAQHNDKSQNNQSPNSDQTKGNLIKQTAGQQTNLSALFDAYSNDATRSSANWNGTWSYLSRSDSNNLVIKSLSAKKLKFAFNVLHGANTGEIEGTAKVKGKMAYFKDATVEQSSAVIACELLLINNTKSIEVRQNAGCSSFGGIGVVFGGEYSKGASAKKQLKNVELNDPLLPDVKLNEAFKKLVDADYQKFFDTFQITYENEEKDLDGFGASILTGGVSGLFSIKEGIIMYDKAGKMWAAILEAEHNAVYYYSNDSKYSTELPRTIQNWKDKKQPKWTVIFKTNQK